jgi:hypothetical protein
LSTLSLFVLAIWELPAMGLFNFGKKKETFFVDLSEGATPAATAPAPEAKPAAPSAAKPKAPAPKAAKSKPAAKAEAVPAPVAAAPTPQPEVAAEPVAEVITNFATAYLMPSGTLRRGPGPSLNTFIGMAQEIVRR